MQQSYSFNVSEVLMQVSYYGNFAWTSSFNRQPFSPERYTIEQEGGMTDEDRLVQTVRAELYDQTPLIAVHGGSFGSQTQLAIKNVGLKLKGRIGWFQ
jgi:hypothetical protein